MVVIAGTLGLGVLLVLLVIIHFWLLVIVVNVFSVAWSLLLYVRGRERGAQPSGKGLVRDFCMGVEQNPTWKDVDLKVFAYQPSLIGLGLLVALKGF